jgi:hypothetical protein
MTRAMMLSFLLMSIPLAAGADEFTPPQGKTLIFIGQDEATIQSYIRATGHTPDGFMTYTSIQNMDGLSEPVDFGAGTNHAQYLADNFPEAAFQIGLYMVDTLEGVVSGQYDHQIQKLADWLKHLHHRVYLRIGYEFDLPDNHYAPALYQQAFRYIVDHLRAEGVDNVAYVWHSYGYITPGQPMMDWYPGDEYVDFFAVSFFKAFNSANMNFVLKRAQEHQKPFMIAEATPQGYTTSDGEKVWSMWYKPFFQFIDDHDVPIVSYIDANWDSQPMWQGKGWGDARVQANSMIAERWLKEMKSERFRFKQ